jgi:hypothetical protein
MGSDFEKGGKKGPHKNRIERDQWVLKMRNQGIKDKGNASYERNRKARQKNECLRQPSAPSRCLVKCSCDTFLRARKRSEISWYSKLTTHVRCREDENCSECVPWVRQSTDKRFISMLRNYFGRVMAQVISRRLHAAEADVRSRVSPCEVVDKTALTQVFLRVFHFPLSIYFHRGSPYSNIILGDKQ